MKTIRIDSEDQLESFLKILAEESVKKSLAQILEAEEDAVANPEADENDDADEADDADDDNSDEGGAEETEEDSEEDIEEKEAENSSDVSFISFRDNIDAVRSGKSLKRSEVKSEVEVFFNRLTSQDKKFFHDALSTLGKIMVGELAGADAALPGGPDGEDTSQEISVDNATNSGSSQETQDSGGIEPPIKIGESQDKLAIRRRVRMLMGY